MRRRSNVEVPPTSLEVIINIFGKTGKILEGIIYLLTAFAIIICTILAVCLVCIGIYIKAFIVALTSIAMFLIHIKI